MRLARWISLALTLAACFAPAAAAGPHIAGPAPAKLIAKLPTHYSVTSDDDRYLLVRITAEGRYRLIDDEAGSAREVDLGCYPTRGSRGTFVLNCLDGPDRLFSARRLESGPVPGSQPGDQLNDVGRYWVAGEVPGEEMTVYLSRRTGERREESREGPFARPVRDLDSPGLMPAIPQPGDDEVLFARSPLAVLSRFGDRQTLVLYRRGERVTRLTRCDLFCGAAVGVGRDRVLWYAAAGYGPRCGEPGLDSTLRCYRVHGYVVDGGGPVTWRLARVLDNCDLGCDIGVAMTRRRVYMQVPTRVKASHDPSASRQIADAVSSRLYAARWPR